MRIFRFHNSQITSLFAAALAFGTPTAAAAENCTLIQLASFDMANEARIVVPVTIDRTPARMLVDTGAADARADAADSSGTAIANAK